MDQANDLISESTVIQALRGVIDPELDCNVYDLGLIYDIQLSGDGVRVLMTLTSMGCPMQQALVEGVQNALLSMPGIQETEVELVWDPPWQPAMMTPEGQRRTGIA